MSGLLGLPARAAHRVVDEAAYARAAWRAGMLGVDPPPALARIVAGLLRHGPVGGLLSLAAARYGDGAAIVDERGRLTYVELDRRANAVANGWRAAGLRPGDGVAVLARNHRGFLEAVFAAARCGARIVLLNTDFAGPQLVEVCGREGVDLLVHDDEYTALLTGVEPRLGRVLSWVDGPDPAAAAEVTSLDRLVASFPTSSPPRPGTHAKLVLLTSGTTGTPKGAPRKEPLSLAPFGVQLERIPFRGRGVTAIPAPMFHTLGFAHAMLALALGCTIVTRRRFDAEALLDDIETHRVTALIAVPIMVQRLLEAEEAGGRRRDLSSLQVVFVAGSQLGAALATRILDRVGPVLYNLYGSTEVAYATIAGPDDLRAAPACVGRPLRGTTVRLLDDDGREVPQGATGRIFVGNGMQFDGYTGGGTKEMVGGLMSSGDVGHFDAEGRLHVDGRDDDMIVSGGENVFPGEVEELLARRAEVGEVSVIGVPDVTYGHRLVAFVVPAPGEKVDGEALRLFVRENLARYKVPREIRVIDAMPRNPTGKVLKRALRDLAAEEMAG
ncbi:MAG TPA: acyl-CoA synthetase [Acidimicrobiales bacterium]|nr:acyl-CoA synthetase [Acidimicrobiales bacterium]